jgi:Xaa-Pro aminopeptidase
MARRRHALASLLAEKGISQVLVYGFDRSGSAIGWLRTGAAMSDDAVAALAAAARPGMTEPQCCASLEGAYIGAGGLTHIHYLGVTSMARPGLCVPAQWPSTRRLADVILGAGYTIYDDLVHGYGGGYLPPVISRADLEGSRAADFTFAAGMTVVIQPNVITPDERAGVQTGELVLVTETGWESLHRFPRGLARIGDHAH